MSNGVGIEETKDVIEYAGAVVDKLTEHKADDGKIDGAEITSTLVSTVPAGVRAVAGSGDIKEELAKGNLSDEEKDELLALAMPVLMNLIGLFVKVEEEKA
jgi:hypothetical protein